MKNSIIAIIFMFCSFYGTALISAGDGPHNGNPAGNIPNDSVLFDGNGNFNYSPYKSDRMCKVIVRYVQGTADGEVEHIEVADICSVYDTAMIVKPENLKTGDTLHMGSEIKTGDGASASADIFRRFGSAESVPTQN